jgi:hypothetical protein
MAKCFVLLLATVLCCLPLYAQFGGFATWARQREAPAQITQLEGLGAWAKVENTSKQTITDVQLASVLKMLCTDKPTSPVVKINGIEHINLEPNATIQIETRPLPKDNLGANDPVVLQAQKLNAVAKIEFGFVYVKFADGTSWRYDLKNIGGFGPPNPTEETAICQQVRTGKNQ